MIPPGDQTIRIPFTAWQRFWLFIMLLPAIASIAASAITRDPHFMFGIVVIIPIGSWVGYWLGRTPGKIEFATPYSFFVIPRGEDFTFLYEMDWKERGNLPDSKYFGLDTTGFRWSNERLEIITPRECIFIGSGPKMDSIRGWLVQHGVRPR